MLGDLQEIIKHSKSAKVTSLNVATSKEQLIVHQVNSKLTQIFFLD